MTLLDLIKNNMWHFILLDVLTVKLHHVHWTNKTMYILQLSSLTHLLGDSEIKFQLMNMEQTQETGTPMLIVLLNSKENIIFFPYFVCVNNGIQMYRNQIIINNFLSQNDRDDPYYKHNKGDAGFDLIALFIVYSIVNKYNSCMIYGVAN